jgi:hypothetical protein
MLRNRVTWPNCCEHTVVVASWTLQDVKEELGFTAARRWCASLSSRCRFPTFIGEKRLRDRMRALGTVLKVPSCRVRVLTLCFRRSDNRGLHKSRYIDLVGIEVMPDDLPEPPAGNRRQGGPSRDIDHRVDAVLSSSLRRGQQRISHHIAAPSCVRARRTPRPQRENEEAAHRTETSRPETSRKGRK